MTVGRKRKRYLLLTSGTSVGTEEQKELTLLILERFPDMERRLVWLERGLIVRTDAERLAEVKVALALKVGEVRLETKSVSGSISKLKRMMKDGGR